MGSLVSRSVAAPNACCGNIPPYVRSRSFAELIPARFRLAPLMASGLKSLRMTKGPGQSDPIPSSLRFSEFLELNLGHVGV